MSVALWTQLECHLGLIASCFPAVNMIFMRFVGGGHGSEHSGPEVDILSVDLWMENGAQRGLEVSEEMMVLNVLTVRGRAGGEAEGRRRSMVEGSGDTIGLS